LQTTKYNLSFGKNRGIREKLVATIYRMPHNRLASIIKNDRPKGRRNQGKPLKRLSDV